MTKEQLKAAIRKILEKEGGAAGMKALKKQSDSSEKDIKASIKDDEKVGQHPDGDYILAKGKVSLSEVIEQEVMNYLDEKRKKKRKKKKKKKQDACYYKVKSRYKVWPSAYASGALVKCRKVGAKNWGNSKKEADEPEIDDGEEKQIKKVIGQLTKSVKMHDDQAEFLKKLIDEEIGFFLQNYDTVDEESLRTWFKGGGWRQAGGKYDGKPCARQPGQKTKPKCVSRKKYSRMSKKQRDSAGRRKRRKDKNPSRRGKPINVNTDPKRKSKKKGKKNEQRTA